MPWSQTYDPLNNPWLSTAVASLPVVVLLGCIAFAHVRIWISALLGLGTALAVALWGFHMPTSAALGAAGFGAAYGLFPIGWIVLNVMFLHALTVRCGRFETLRVRLATLAPDARVQVILIAFSFGAFIEGVAGFGTPVAITAAMLMQLGFRPLQASGLSLIANTAPVAFGAVGIPIITLAQVTGLDVLKLSAMAGRQLPLFSLIVPFWIVWAMCGLRGLLGVWPVALVAGGSFGIVQFLVSNFHGPWLVDSAAAVTSIGCVVLLLRFWKPKQLMTLAPEANTPSTSSKTSSATSTTTVPPGPWMPWIVLSVFLFLWGLPQAKDFFDGKKSLGTVASELRMPSVGQGVQLSAKTTAPAFATPGLHLQVTRTPPVVKQVVPEKAEFRLNWLSATGTAIFLAAILGGFLMGFNPRQLAREYWVTLLKVRGSLLTIAAMLALGNVTKYSGADATLGLAMAGTGSLYPFFGTLLGWLGVALTGSDTASNVLFGSLQRITAEQLGLNPVLMCAANSTGGVMGKMIDAQSIVVASVATGYHNKEGEILRYVFFHSLVLAALVGLLVYGQAYWPVLAPTVVMP